MHSRASSTRCLMIKASAWLRRRRGVSTEHVPALPDPNKHGEGLPREPSTGGVTSVVSPVVCLGSCTLQTPLARCRWTQNTLTCSPQNRRGCETQSRPALGHARSDTRAGPSAQAIQQLLQTGPWGSACRFDPQACEVPRYGNAALVLHAMDLARPDCRGARSVQPQDRCQVPRKSLPGEMVVSGQRRRHTLRNLGSPLKHCEV